ALLNVLHLVAVGGHVGRVVEPVPLPRVGVLEGRRVGEQVAGGSVDVEDLGGGLAPVAGHHGDVDLAADHRERLDVFGQRPALADLVEAAALQVIHRVAGALGNAGHVGYQQRALTDLIEVAAAQVIHGVVAAPGQGGHAGGHRIAVADPVQVT